MLKQGAKDELLKTLFKSFGFRALAQQQTPIHVQEKTGFTWIK